MCIYLFIYIYIFIYLCIYYHDYDDSLDNVDSTSDCTRMTLSGQYGMTPRGAKGGAL